MIIEKRTPRLPDWSFSSLTGLFGRRVPDDVGGWVRADDTPPIRLLVDIGTAVHIADRFVPAFNRRWEAFSLPRFELSDELDNDGVRYEKYAIGVPIWSPQINGMHMLIVRGAYAVGALTDLIVMAEGLPEAARGEIPVVDWTGGIECVVKKGPGKGRTFYSPRLVVAGWMPRPDQLFGPRLNPQPKPAPLISFDTLQLMPPTAFAAVADALADEQPPPTGDAYGRLDPPYSHDDPNALADKPRRKRAAGGGGSLIIDDVVPFAACVL